MYILVVTNPPKTMINIIESICANFLWSEGEHGHRYYWVAWQKCCSPITEGGLGIRSIYDVVKAFFIKLLWQLRTSSSLWAQFMKCKYNYNAHLNDCGK